MKTIREMMKVLLESKSHQRLIIKTKEMNCIIPHSQGIMILPNMRMKMIDTFREEKPKIREILYNHQEKNLKLR